MLVATLVGMRDSKNNLQQWLVLKHDQYVGCYIGWHERCLEHVGNMLGKLISGWEGEGSR